MVELKQTKKQLETKEAEKSQAELAAHDVGMTKAAESLIAQLKDVTRAFFLEVWGQALSAVGVSTESELWAPDKVYYPLALHLAPTPPQPLVDPIPIPISSLEQPAFTPSDAPNKDKEPKEPPPVDVVDVGTEETTEVA